MGFDREVKPQMTKYRMPDPVQSSVLSDPLAIAIPPSLVPDWANRRKVIFAALWFCAAMTGLIICTGCIIAFMGVFYHVQSEASVLGLLGSALYTLAFVATSIIGSYVFGVNLDWANTRQHIADLVTTTTATISPPPGDTTVVTAPMVRRSKSAATPPG
jgi:hypothetical protein